MKRVLVFDGPKAAEQFRLLIVMKDAGVVVLDKERTLDDADLQADLDDQIEAIGVRFDDALPLGTVDADTLDEFREWERLQGKDGIALHFRPRTATNAHQLYLKPSSPAPRLVLEEGGTYKLLKKLLDKAAPRVSGRLAREVRDLRKFVESAPDPAKEPEPATA